MNAVKTNVRSTSFWGKYILNTTGNLIERKLSEEKEEKERRIHLAKLYEMVDDYVEQS